MILSLSAVKNLRKGVAQSTTGLKDILASFPETDSLGVVADRAAFCARLGDGALLSLAFHMTLRYVPRTDARLILSVIAGRNMAAHAACRDR